MKTAASARAFLTALAKAAPCHIRTILTDNGKEFTDLLFGKLAKDASGEHEFDQLCEALGIEHRLTKPRTPRTNGMVERFNGRIEQVLRTHHFKSGEDLETTLLRAGASRAQRRIPISWKHSDTDPGLDVVPARSRRHTCRADFSVPGWLCSPGSHA